MHLANQMEKDRDTKRAVLTLQPPALVDAAPDLFSVDVERPEFMHAVLCQVGLPRSRTDARSFTRTSGSAVMSLTAGQYHDIKGKLIDAPLPYGTKPRLLLFHICSEVVRTKRPEVDLGRSAREFLDRIGITHGGPELRRFKEQSRALAAMHMLLSFQTQDGKMRSVKTDPIESFDAWLPVDDSQGQLWPDELRVSRPFMETLLEHAVPLDPAAIHSLQGSALALDVYTWMAHRLCRIRKDGGVPLYWTQLKEQFGQEYRELKDFKKKFRPALVAALKAYPSARVEEITGGLRLFPSAPPVRRMTRTVVKLAPPDPVISIDKIRLKPETLDAVRTAAPGWDKYYLENQWRGWIEKVGAPKNPDKAFLAWCRKFTKGKRP